jgi:hypothetical protein
MPSLVADLERVERDKLLKDLNYLNTLEIKTFCRRHSIPYSIWIETGSGSYKKTSDDDRKGVILHRLRHFLLTGKVLPATCFVAEVVSLVGPSVNIKATDRLRYGQYEKNSRPMLRLLRKLTAGQFKSGAIARILAREFWSKGIAPTYKEFAAAWMSAVAEHKRPNPEWAFLSDRAEKKATSQWKRLRSDRAKQVLNILNRL